jgi:hypothetical protein
MKGIFLDGSIKGLDYYTQTHSGVIDEQGCYEYEQGEEITFSIGDLVIGSCQAKAYITPVDFVVEADCREASVSHYQVVNTARLLIGLKTITEQDKAIIEEYQYTWNPVMEPQKYEEATAEMMDKLGKKLARIETAKNLVRRSAAGILKETDVRIPTRDGNYVLADVYRPLQGGEYPVVMCMGVFGKSFINGFPIKDGDEEYFEMLEDKFYDDYSSTETKKLLQGAFFRRMASCFGSALPIPNLNPEDEVVHPDGPPPCLVPISEAFEQPCALDWVPYGYVVINIEERGMGQNPLSEDELFKQFGRKNAEDYCDAIEWAADMPWSSGKIGLFGASYYAMTQYLAAQRRPKGLTAMIPIMGDYDSYRDYIYSGGGLFNRADNMDPCTTPQEYDFMKKALDEPFWNEETYGVEGEYMSSCDISKIDYPIWSAVEPDASLHGKGSSEAYINCSSENKKLLVVNGCGIHYWMYNEFYLNKYRSFFDYWLKGEDNDIMDEPPVSIQMRTGNGGYYWRNEEDWPVPGTEYKKFYLDAKKMSLSESKPEADGKVSYNADVYHSINERVEGATFISEPLKEDLEVAGYIKAGLYVSSTTNDMEIHIKVRIFDENDREVIYPARTSMERELPLGFGAMLASHRELDQERSRDYLPVYKHTKEAYQPLVPEEMVSCEVGTFPTTGVIRAGWKICLEIDPVDNRWVNYNEESYRTGSENTIYTGEIALSYLQLPVLPLVKQGK